MISYTDRCWLMHVEIDNNTVLSPNQTLAMWCHLRGPLCHSSVWLTYFRVCSAKIHLYAHLDKYRPFIATLQLISIMIWRTIEHLLREGFTWIAKKCIWKQVRQIVL